MVSILQIHDYAKDYWVEFSTCTFIGTTLIWWNIQVKTLGVDTTYTIPWERMKRRIVVEFWPMEIVQRMEQQLHYLTIEEENLLAYTKCFEDLATICLNLINSEEKKIKKYIEGRNPSIQGAITNVQPDIYHKTKELAFSLVEKTTYIRTNVERMKA